jgi:hypothetical protein
MKSNLNEIANQGQDDANYFYYMLEAVHKHEDLHVSQYKENMEKANAFTKFKSSIEQLSIDLNKAENAEAAKVEFRSGYFSAKSNLYFDHIDAIKETADHTRRMSFILAEQFIVGVKILEIEARQTLLSCSK